jgi:hypothetical protein
MVSAFNRDRDPLATEHKSLAQINNCNALEKHRTALIS